MSGQDNNDERRQIQNIKGLLRFCMESTRSEDAPSISPLQPMTEERKKWLEEALTNMTVSPVERMNVCVTAIEEAVVDTEEGTEQQIRAVTELQDWAEELNTGGDFIKINGLRIVPKLLASEVSELRWRCCELLGNLAQNNPPAQSALLELRLLDVMTALLDTDPNPTVQVKALYCISCLVRNNAEAQSQFLANDGFSVLVRSLHSEEEKLRIKATFLITAVCRCSNPALKDTLVEKGVIEQLTQLLKEEDHGSSHEHTMSALLSIVTDHAEAYRKCQSEELDLKSFLNKRIRFLEGKEEFQEEKESAEQLLQTLNSTCPSSQPSGPSNSSAGALMVL